MQNKFIIKSVLLSLSFLVVFAKKASSQLLGPDCVQQDQYYSFYLDSYDYNDYFSWYVNGGVISSGSSSESGTGLSSIVVKFTSSSGYVSVSYSNGSGFISVTAYGPFSAGSINGNLTQTIAYNATPGIISCSGPAGGSCSPSYSYQWQKSTNGTSWSDISGQTAASLNFSGGLTQTSYYRRYTLDLVSYNSGFSDVATVYVNPPLSVGSISSSQNIFSGSSPSTLTGSAAS